MEPPEDELDLVQGNVVVILLHVDRERAFKELLQPLLINFGYDWVLPRVADPSAWGWRLLQQGEDRALCCRRADHEPAADAPGWACTASLLPGPCCDGDASCGFQAGAAAPGIVAVRAGGVGSSSRGVGHACCDQVVCHRHCSGSGRGASPSSTPESGSVSSLGAFPWHPGCARLARRGCRVDRRTCLAAAAARAADRGEAAASRTTSSGVAAKNDRDTGMLMVPLALHDDPAFLKAAAAAVQQHNQEHRGTNHTCRAAAALLTLEPSADPAAHHAPPFRHRGRCMLPARVPRATRDVCVAAQPSIPASIHGISATACLPPCRLPTDSIQANPWRRCCWRPPCAPRPQRRRYRQPGAPTGRAWRRTSGGARCGGARRW
jgi:hypothetical protein